ncbi:unnamed protein product [Effrenium voratum]|nr:unnamed protein product [Effrenium voratum]
MHAISEGRKARNLVHPRSIPYLFVDGSKPHAFPRGPVGAVIGGGIAALAASSSKRSSVRLPSLGVSTISLPREGMCEHNGVTYFAVDVVHSTRGTWRVMRRYNEFRELKRYVRGRCRFPRKLWFGCEGPRLEERRHALEVWLRHVALRYTANGMPWRVESPLRDFLERGSNQVPVPDEFISVQVPPGVVPGQPLTVTAPGGPSFIIVVPEGASPGAMLRVQRPPNTSGDTPLALGDQNGTANKVLLSVSVPAGVRPGQMLAVKVPDGRELTVVVPPDAPQELQLEFDAAQGRLTVAPTCNPQTNSQGSGGEMFSIQLPPGSEPGRAINIQVPDGRTLPFTVPAGRKSGETWCWFAWMRRARGWCRHKLLTGWSRSIQRYKHWLLSFIFIHF